MHTSVTNSNLVNKPNKNQFNNYIVREDYVPRVLRNPSLAKRSRILCYILLWGAKNAGLHISPDGYVLVVELLSSRYFADSSLDDIRKIVELDDKERFSMATDEVSGKTKVRANHGHGIPGIVVTERKLTARDAPGAVIHLTTQEAWKSIQLEGLSPLQRNCIDFVRRLPMPGEKVAGVREDADVCIFVDTAKAIDAGITFSVTPSGVIVTEGDEEHRLPPQYFKKVMHLNSREQLYPRTEKEPKDLSLYDDKVEHVKAADAYGNQFAYFVWAKFGHEQVDVLMLLDTGASITLLPSKVFESIPDRPQLHNTTVRIEVGNGQNLDVQGVCPMTVQLGDYDFVHNFFVCRDCTHAILGNDFIILQDITMRMKQGWLEFKGHDIPLFNMHGARVKNRVYLAQIVVLPPMREVEVPTYLSHHHPSNRPQMFEPSETMHDDTGALSPRMLFDSTDRHPRVRLFNPTNKEVTVGVHRCLGNLTGVEDISAEATVGQDHVQAVRSLQVGEPNSDASSSAIRATNENGGKELGTIPEGEALETKYDKVRGTIPSHIRTLVDDCTAHLTSTQKKKVVALLCKFEDVFARHEADIGKTDLITHDVDTGSAKPVAQSARRQSPEEYEAMVKTVDNLYKCGIIRPSRSQWAAKIRMAKKKNGSWRMCIDYRDLNKRTIITDPYPLPRIDALMDTLGKGKWFCALDLISGYHQVPMTPRAQEKLAFITPQMSPSHWEYVYMPFGLTGAPATFQRLVDTLLRGIQYRNVLAYIDDIIVIGQTVEECCDNLMEVLVRIRRAKLKLNQEKCELFKTQITYLGHVVSAKRICTDPKKVKAVAE